MKKLIPTMVVVVILIAGWLYAANHNYFREEEAVQAKLLGVASADIQAITLYEGEGDKSGGGTNANASKAVSTLERKDGIWQMSQPKAYPLNEYSMGSWLDALSGAHQDMVVEESPKDVEKYGLGSTATTLDIKVKDGRELKLVIGKQLPAGDAHYVRVDAGPVVAVGNEAVTNIALTRHSLLDTTPFNMDEANVRTLEWEGEAASWMLKASAQGDTASEHAWTLNGSPIQAEDAISLIGNIKNLTTAEDVRKASELKGAIPRSTLSVEQQVNGQETTTVYRLLTLSSEPDQIWVITPDGEWAYAMDAAALKEAEEFPASIKNASSASSDQKRSSVDSESDTSSTATATSRK